MTGLELYKILFMTEILVAEGLLTFRMKKRKLFAVRVLCSLAVCYLAAFFYPVFENLHTGWYTSIMFLALFFLTLGGILVCYDISFKNAFFCATVAYTTQHISYELFKLIMLPFGILVANNLYGSSPMDFTAFDSATLIVVLSYFEVCLAVYVGVYFLIGKKIRGNDLHLKNTNVLVIAAVILLVDVILNAVVVYIDADYNRIYDLIVGIYNCLCCLFVFYTLRSIIAVNDIKNELKTVSYLLEQAKRQFQIKKEEIGLINIKCHDLKHQISRFALRGGLDGETVDEIKEMISIYDASVKTGNEVLDIILTEKSLVCQKKNIKLTCMADCADLDFMGDGELYALFGNIFDNAIEAVSRVENDENRCIGFHIRRQGDFISVMEENYYADEIKFDADGLPITRKEDKKNHGLGMKSIRLIVKKYGGDISVVAEDGVFRLNIFLPVAEKDPDRKSDGKPNRKPEKN